MNRSDDVDLESKSHRYEWTGTVLFTFFPDGNQKWQWFLCFLLTISPCYHKFTAVSEPTALAWMTLVLGLKPYSLES